jgi:hypothetical protein
MWKFCPSIGCGITEILPFIKLLQGELLISGTKWKKENVRILEKNTLSKTSFYSSH